MRLHHTREQFACYGSHDVTIHRIPEGAEVSSTAAWIDPENKLLGFDDTLTVEVLGLKGGKLYVAQDHDNEQHYAQFNQILTPKGNPTHDIATLDFSKLDTLPPEELEKLRDSFVIHTTGKENTAILAHIPTAGIEVKPAEPGIGEHANKVAISFKGVRLGTLDGYDDLRIADSKFIEDLKKQDKGQPPSLDATIYEGTGLPTEVNKKTSEAVIKSS